MNEWRLYMEQALMEMAIRFKNHQVDLDQYRVDHGLAIEQKISSFKNQSKAAQLGTITDRCVQSRLTLA